MVHTRRSGDSVGNTSSEMPVKDETLSTADPSKLDEDDKKESGPSVSRRHSHDIDESRHARRRSVSESQSREQRNRAEIGNGARSSTRSRDRPERYVADFEPSHRRMKNLRPRTAHIYYHSSDDSDNIFSPAVARKSRRIRSSKYESRSSGRLSNGHVNNVGDESEGIRRSTRKRKLVYDSFNTSWILNTHGHDLRRYRSKGEPYEDDEDLESENEEVGTKADENNRGEEEEEEEEEEEGNEDKNENDEENKDEDDDDDDDDDDENEDNETEKIKDNKKEEGTKNDDGFTDMYSRVKRTRRKRIMFQPEGPITRRRSRRGKVSESSDNDGHSSEEEEEDGRSQSPRRRSKYHLRQRRSKVQHFQIDAMRAEPLRRAAMSLLRSPMRRKRRRSRYKVSSASPSSSDSEHDRKKQRNRNMCLPVNYTPTDKPGSSQQTSGKAGPSNLADTDPMELDPTIRFTHVGGLEEHIKCLKEMVVFPMLYPEVFDKFLVQPPKGVLFHGPPGTGKTLLARALANECSQGTQKVSFFMRKGADVLSKWVGESERQLRLLFNQAYQMRPSIIFFDEIDGLAPVRSCKQDQIHASVVSTLLALMDGLKNRGEVLVIGATNRIDAIDPALRRPGRFDRELYFPLPSAKERLDILNIHMSQWKQLPPPDLVAHLAESSSGYCGSDLRALCTEAVIKGLRRRYPQIYESTQKLLLDESQVQVEKCDFERALRDIVPAAQRATFLAAYRLSSLVEPLLRGSLTKTVEQLAKSFPHCNSKSIDDCKVLAPYVPHPRLLITGNPDQGHVTHIGPAILHHMEHVSVHSFDMNVLFGTPGATQEEVCIQLFREANRQLPGVIYIPEIDKWWNLVSSAVHSIFTSRLSAIPPYTSLLFLATSSVPFNELPNEVQDLFSEYRDEVVKMEDPKRFERDDFFRPLFLNKAFELPSRDTTNKDEVLEVLPVAPPPSPPKLTEEQTKEIYKKEEFTLRELRIFLREICAKLARNKQFFMFVQPVDSEEAPDYYEIIKDPMDLETIMSKIDRHEYDCASDFLQDINLICRNALEYNPNTTNHCKMIRHRACYLQDTAHALIKAEMDSDFEDKCKDISVSRKKRAFRAKSLAPDFVYTAPIEENKQSTETKSNVNGPTENDTSVNSPVDAHNKNFGTPGNGESKQKKRRSPWARGMIPAKKKKKVDFAEDKDQIMEDGDTPEPSTTNDSTSNEQINNSTNMECEPLDKTIETKENNESHETETTEVKLPSAEDIILDKQEMEKLLNHALDITVDLPLLPLLDLHAQLNKIIQTYLNHLNRSTLPPEIEAELNKFEKLCAVEYSKS